MNLYDRIASAFWWVKGSAKVDEASVKRATAARGAAMGTAVDEPSMSCFAPMRLDECRPDGKGSNEELSGAMAGETAFPDGNSPRDDDDNEFFSFLMSSIKGRHEAVFQEFDSNNNNSAFAGERNRYQSSDTAEKGVEKNGRLEANNLLDVPLETCGWEDAAAVAAGGSLPTGYTVSRSNSSSAARSLKDYELLAYIGKGTFAEVTLARHRETHTFYAVKKISKKKVWDEDCVQCTFTERQLLASFKHPFLVNLHQAFQSQSCLYLVLDFAQGGDLYVFLETKPWVKDMHRKLYRATGLVHHREVGLADSRVSGVESPSRLMLLPGCSPSAHFIPDDGRTPIRIIAFCAVEIALVLHYLHTHGFIYRDLKPENVLIMADGNVVLADFGVAKYRGIASSGTANSSGTRTDFHAGTALYMSPEMLLGEAHDSRVDWWSFGCVLFEMANRRRPFGATTRYDIMKSIVENSVQLVSGDFMPTNLELELRVAQLHCQYEKYRRCRLRRDALAEEGDNRCRGTSVIANVHGVEGLPRPRGDPPRAGRVEGCADRPVTTERLPGLCEVTAPFDESWSAPSAERTNASTADYPFSRMGSTPQEVSEALRKHAAEELTEAYVSLKDLILALLQQSPEKRLSGESVLEHPFFRCPYVTSQLYYDTKTSTADGNEGGCAKSSAACSTTPLWPCVSDDVDRDLEQTLTPFGLQSESSCTVERENTAARSSHSDSKRPSEPGVAGSSNASLVQDFLQHLPIQRPESWSKLFLSRRVKPPYVPHLRAADDLRYFPDAVTASGERVAHQQRDLRRRSTRCGGLRTASAKGRLAEKSRSLSFEPGGLRTSVSDLALSCADEDEECKGLKEGSCTPLSLPRQLMLAGISDYATTPEHEFGGNGKGESDVKGDSGRTQTRKQIDFFTVASPQEFPGSLQSTFAQEFRYETHDNEDKESCLCLSKGAIEIPDCRGDEGTESLKRHPLSPSVTAKVLALDNPSTTSGQVDETRGSAVPAHLFADFQPPSAEGSQRVQEAPRRLSGRSTGVSLRFDASIASSSSRTTYSTSGTECCNAAEKLCSRTEALPETLTGVAYDVDDYAPSTSKARGDVLLNRTGIPQSRLLVRPTAEGGHELRPSVVPDFPCARPLPIGRPPLAAPRPPLQCHQTSSRLPSSNNHSPMAAASTVQREYQPHDDLHSNHSSVASPSFMAQGSELYLPLYAGLGGGRDTESVTEVGGSQKLDSPNFTGASAALPHFMDFTFNSHSGGGRLLSSVEGLSKP